MKKTKYIAGIIIILISSFLLTGLFNRHVEFEYRLQIDKPVKLVYFSMMNPMKMDEWVYGFEKLEALDGFLNGPGSRYLLTLKMGKREMVILEEVTSFNWKKDLGLSFDFGHMIMDMDIEFTEENEVCSLDVHTKVTGTGLLSRSLLSFTRPLIKKHIVMNFEGLKRMLEE